MTIRGILFDKDGTLLDYHKTWMPVNRAVAERVARGDPELTEQLLISGGYDPRLDRVASGALMAAGNNFEISECWYELAGDLWPDFETLLSEVDREFAELCVATATPVAGLDALLSELKGHGLVLGIATADSAAGIHACLGPLGILDQFDFLSGYDSGYKAKPDPDQVYGFMKTTGLASHEVMMVGDNLHDLHMGRAAGAGSVVGVLTGTSTHEDLAPHADHVLADVTEIGAVLAL